MRPYLTLLLNFMGMTSVESFAVEGTTADAAAVEASMAEALNQINVHFGG